MDGDNGALGSEDATSKSVKSASCGVLAQSMTSRTSSESVATQTKLALLSRVAKAQTASLQASRAQGCPVQERPALPPHEMHHPLMHDHVPGHSASPHAATSGALRLQQVQQAVSALKRVARVRRRLTSATCLRVLYINTTMAERLLADVGAGGEEHGYALSAEERACSNGWMVSQAWPRLECTIMLVDGANAHWPVKLVAHRSQRQNHRRMTTGWADFCEANSVQVGDSVEFRRVKGRLICLQARVVRESSGTGKARKGHAPAAGEGVARQTGAGEGVARQTAGCEGTARQAVPT